MLSPHQPRLQLRKLLFRPSASASAIASTAAAASAAAVSAVAALVAAVAALVAAVSAVAALDAPLHASLCTALADTPRVRRGRGRKLG